MSRGNRKKKTKGSQGFNRKNTEEFLVKNATKPDITCLDSGLQYLVVDEGFGVIPDAASRVEVEQRIMLVDGTVIDDTYKKGKRAKFSLEEAIKGYREGLLMMKTGSRYRLFIPPELAWGKRGAGTKIGPNSVLIIDVRLTDILEPQI